MNSETKTAYVIVPDPLSACLGRGSRKRVWPREITMEAFYSLIKLQLTACFVYTYVAISIPGFKLNSKHTFPGSILLCGGIFILITPSTRSYQLPTSQLDNSMRCLCTHFACTYIAISAFSRAFIIACRCFCTANFFYQLCIWLYFPVN